MASSSVVAAGEVRVRRAEALPELADVPAWLGKVGEDELIGQDLPAGAPDPVPVLAALAGLPGVAEGLRAAEVDGAPVLIQPMSRGEWLAGVLDVRARRPAMPPRAALDLAARCADLLERAWPSGDAPPALRPDVRPAALRVGPGGSFVVGAWRVAGAPARDGGDGKGALPGEDTRTGELALLGATLYEMATRRRFGRSGHTQKVHQHHLQRRLSVGELAAFGGQRAALVELFEALLGWQSAAGWSFGRVAEACRDMRVRLEGPGLDEWCAELFPDVPPAAAAPEDVPEPHTPFLGVRHEEATDLPPVVMVAPAPPDDHTETSQLGAGETTPPRPVVLRPPTLTLPEPSIAHPLTPVEAPPDDDEDLPENVIPLRGDARPGSRRGGLVPRPPPEEAAPTPARPASRASERREARVRGPSRRPTGVLIAVAVLVAVPILAAGLGWMALRRPPAESGDGFELAPALAQAEPAEPAEPAVAPAEPDPTPPPDTLAEPAPPADPPAATPAPAVAAAAPTAAAPPRPTPTPPSPNAAATPTPPPLPATPPVTPPPLPAEASPWTVSAPAEPVLVSFSSKPVGLLVTVDGQRRGSAPLKLTLPPGPHVVSFDADGRTVSATVTVEAGGRNAWTLSAAQGKIE